MEYVAEQEANGQFQRAKDYAREKVSEAFAYLWSTNTTGNLEELEASTKESEVTASFAFKLLGKLSNSYDTSIQNKQVENIDEWIVYFLRSFIVSLLHFLFECISDLILCRVAKFFWSRYSDYLMS
jgi:hypothetical protein